MTHDLDEVKHRVQRLRERDEREAARQAGRASDRSPPLTAKRTPADDERWEVHRALQRPMSLRWLLPLLPLPLLLLTRPESRGLAGAAAALLVAIPVGRALFGSLQQRLSFRTFRRWRQALPFQLEGWGPLVDSPHFAAPSHWRLRASLKVECTPEAALDREVISSLLYLFAREANRCFYSPASTLDGFGSDPRQQWTTTDDTAHGSLNTRVVSALYRFLQDELAPVVKQHGGVARVVITADTEEHEIARETIDSDGTAS